MPGSLQQRRELGVLTEPRHRALWEFEDREYHIENGPYILDYSLPVFETPNKKDLLRGLEQLAKLFENMKVPKHSSLMETE